MFDVRVFNTDGEPTHTLVCDTQAEATDTGKRWFTYSSPTMVVEFNERERFFDRADTTIDFESVFESYCTNMIVGLGAYATRDLTAEDTRRIQAELSSFLARVLTEFPNAFDDKRMTDEMIGYLFLMTRNHEGVGFWEYDIPNVNEINAIAGSYAPAFVECDAATGILYYMAM